MLNRQARCVYVANSVGEADVVVACLGEHGIAAQTMGSAILGGLDLTPWAGKGVSPRGVEVWVLDEGRAAEARALLENAATEAASESEKPTDPIDVTCEECGVVTTFPPERFGTTQECRGCAGFVDVETGHLEEENWWDVPVGEDESRADPTDESA